MALKQELSEQETFWDREAKSLEAIYSHQKSHLGVWVDKTFRWDMYERFRYTMRQAEPIAGRTFLDVGCGTGMYTLELARRQAKKVLGLDISGIMVDICQKRAAQENLEGSTEFIKIDLLRYHPSQNFDVCIGIGLFDYIKKPLPMLAKMRLAIRDCAILSFPRKGTWRAVLRKIRLKVKKCQVYFYRRSEIDGLLREAGFKGYHLEEIGQLFVVTAYPE